MQAELRSGQPPQISDAPAGCLGASPAPCSASPAGRAKRAACGPRGQHRLRTSPYGAAALAALLSGIGCHKDPVSAPPEVQPLLYISPADASRLNRQLARDLRARRERRCARPVLRGPAVAGRPDPLLRDLVETSGALAPCARAAARHQSTLASWLLGPPDDATPLPRLNPRVFRGAPPPEVRGALSELRARCGSLAAAIARVTRFRSVCNPYLPDGGPRPSLLPLVRLHLAAAALAVSMTRQKPDEAMWLLLETLRLGQDLERGPTGLAWPLALVAASRPVVSVLGAWLHAGIPARLVPTLVHALDTLIATEPWPPSLLRGERLRREWSVYALRGGRAVQHRSGVATQARLLAWIGFHRKATRLAQACAKPTPARTCLARLKGLETRQTARSVTALRARWERLQALLARPVTHGSVSAAERQRITRQALDLVEALVDLHAGESLRSGLERAFYLVALRLQVASGTGESVPRTPPRPASLRGRPGHHAPARRVTAAVARAMARAHPIPWLGEPPRVTSTPGGPLLLAPPLRLAPPGKPPLRYQLTTSYSSSAPSVP